MYYAIGVKAVICTQRIQVVTQLLPYLGERAAIIFWPISNSCTDAKKTCKYSTNRELVSGTLLKYINMIFTTRIAIT
jgi:hypothetical protein